MLRQIARLSVLSLPLSFPSGASASRALGLLPSPGWSGIDSLWSTFDVQIGSGNNTRLVSLLPSTALSETWFVEQTGCSQSPLCAKARGGLFDPGASSSWQSLGAWSLGHQSWVEEPSRPGSGDYGLENLGLCSLGPNDNPDTLHSGDSRDGAFIHINGALMAGINDTQYYLGYLGLGPAQGNFSGSIVSPLLSQLSETLGIIPSHSYGFTAGASYINNGTPASLTLGGFDASRFEDGQSSQRPWFSLNASTYQPQVLLGALSARNSSSNDSAFSAAVNVTATIDSTTPFLWLPREPCEQLASAMGLVWNETLHLYLFPNHQSFSDYYAGRGVSLTFSLSDDKSPSGDGEANLTLSSSALTMTAKYPYSPSMAYGDPPVSYFPLQCQHSLSTAAVLGRVFLQEVYMIMRFDDSRFSLHPARFPQDPRNSVQLVDIPRPPDSPYPAFPGPAGSDGHGQGTGTDSKGHGAGSLSTKTTAGIAVAVSMAVTGGLVGMALWNYIYKKHEKQRDAEKNKAGQGRASPGSSQEDDESKAGDAVSVTVVSSESPSPPHTTFLGRLWLFITSGQWPRVLPKDAQGTQGAEGDEEIGRQQAHEVSGSFKHPVEMGAGIENSRFEMPVPEVPVELDAEETVPRARLHPGDIEGYYDEYGFTLHDSATDKVKDGQTVDTYETVRCRMLSQMRGPVPAYSPPEDTSFFVAAEVAEAAAARQRRGQLQGSEHETRSSAHHPPLHALASADSPTSSSSVSSPDTPSTVSLPISLPSPLTPNSVEYTTGNLSFLPSPMTIAPPTRPLPSPSSPSSEAPAPNSAHNARFATRSGRLKMEPSRVICLGPLPENVQVPVPFSKLQPQQQQLQPAEGEEEAEDDTLGTDYTIEEAEWLASEARQREETEETEHAKEPVTDAGRIDVGSELVHVPQPAARRYSWEEDDRTRQ